MRKITLSLFFIALFFGQLSSQITITVTAPPANYFSQSLLPSGPAAHNYQNGCFLITQAELSALLSTNLTGFGFKLERGTNNVPVTGNINIYLENTNDGTYQKGTGFGSALFSMSQVYSGPMTIPFQNNPSDLMFTFPSGFNYTGGGLYVAYEWVANTTPSNQYAVYYTNRVNFNIGGYRSSTTNNPATLNSLALSQLRPVCLIEATNNATNEAGVVKINAMGKIPEAMHIPQIITADVRNSSLGALTNLNVVMNVGGANPFTDTQVIPSIAPGAVATVTFAPYTCNALGGNTINISIPADQNNANNAMDWAQDITCNIASHCPPASNFTTSYGNLNNGTMCMSKFSFSVNTKLKELNLEVGTDWSTTNAKMYGVLLDNTGVILATTNTITPTSMIFNTTQTFTFATPQLIPANQEFYVGMAQTKGFLMGATQTLVPNGLFYSSNLAGTNITPFTEAYLGIEPVFIGPEITVTQATSVICVGRTIALTAHGASNYTWTSSVFNPIPDPNASSISVSPNNNEIYTVYGEDDAGCGATSVAYLKVNMCLGVEENAGIQDIKLYPNPSNGKAFISGLQGTTTVEVYNILGELVMKTQGDSETVSIDLGGQPSGNYLVKVTNSDNQFKTINLLHQN